MIDILRSLQRYLLDNWPELVWIVCAAAGAAYIAGRRSRSNWMNRSFLDRLNVSLNIISDDRLRIRTVLETDVETVFLNRSAAKQISQLAKRTTEQDPLIPIPREDCWYFLNSVLNEISERFALGFLREDAGLEGTKTSYLVCLTCEQAGSVRTHKIRAMLIKKATLENLPSDCPGLEHPSHITRWETLKTLAQRWELAPHYFIEIEIVL